MERVFRRLTAATGGESHDGFFRWMTRELHPFGNVVFPSARLAGGVLRTAIAPLVEANVPAAVLFPSGMSAAAPQDLSAAGFTDGGAIPAMTVDIERLAKTELPDGYAFTPVTGGGQGEAWAEALAVGYGIPRGLARLLSPAAIDPRTAAASGAYFFAIVRADRVVATSMLFVDDGLAGIYSVATLADERRKGLGGHVTAEALRFAGTMGYRVGILQSSQAGHSVYRTLGFDDAGAIPMFVRMPG